MDKPNANPKLSKVMNFPGSHTQRDGIVGVLWIAINVKKQFERVAIVCFSIISSSWW